MITREATSNNHIALQMRRPADGKILELRVPCIPGCFVAGFEHFFSSMILRMIIHFIRIINPCHSLDYYYSPVIHD